MFTQLIKELRIRTGAGFLDCKIALEASNNDIEKAIIFLQKKGISKATKKAGAVAIEGAVKAFSDGNVAIIFELNSQTDFVAQNNDFKFLLDKICEGLIKNEFKSIDEAKKIIIDKKTIEELIVDATSKFGEKIALRRAERFVYDDKTIATYTHVNGKVAAIIIAEGGDKATVRNVAMHVAAMNPEFLDEKSIPVDQINNMKTEIENSPTLKGKPENIRQNIAQGMLRKRLSELTLVDQEFVMEKISVAKYLSKNNSKALQMIRYEVGEGIA